MCGSSFFLLGSTNGVSSDTEANEGEDSEEEEELARPSRLNASLLIFGRRSDTRPFVIEYQRMFRGLGVKVLLDEEELVMITDISPSGLVGKDGNIRYMKVICLSSA